jgi:hypothetical protein
MSFVQVRIPAELRDRIDGVRPSKVSRESFVRALLDDGVRVLEAALSEAKGVANGTQAGPAPVLLTNPQKGIAVEGVRPAASPRAPGRANIVGSPSLERFAAGAAKNGGKR